MILVFKDILDYVSENSYLSLFVNNKCVFSGYRSECPETYDCCILKNISVVGKTLVICG